MSEVKVDTISERTAANGVAVDGVTIKDSGLTIPSGGTLTIDSGGIITNNGSSSGFGSRNTDAAFLETRSGDYYTSIGDNTWGKMPVGEASATTHFDTASGFDSTNNRWTCPSGQAGKYLIGHSLAVHSNGSLVYTSNGALYKNGSVLERSEDHHRSNSAVADHNKFAFVPYLVELSVGDYIEWYTKTWWASSNRILAWSKWGFKLT